MRQVRLPSFQRERQVFALRFTCEHCTFFDIHRELCAHGYPNADHREAGAGTAELDALVFCKEFELM